MVEELSFFFLYSVFHFCCRGLNAFAPVCAVQVIKDACHLYEALYIHTYYNTQLM